MRNDLIINVEVNCWIEAENFLRGGDFVITQSCAVCATRIHLGWRWVANDCLDADERWASGLCLSVSYCLQEGDNIFSGLDGLHVPAISFVARINVLVESDIGVVFDRNTVVIPENDQVAQLLGASERGSLGSNAFLQITIGSNDVNVVVERRFPSWCLRIKKTAFLAGRHSHAHRRSQTLPQWTGGDFDTISVANFGVTRS